MKGASSECGSSDCWMVVGEIHIQWNQLVLNQERLIGTRDGAESAREEDVVQGPTGANSGLNPERNRKSSAEETF